jgi:hypothetical protein
MQCEYIAWVMLLVALLPLIADWAIRSEGGGEVKIAHVSLGTPTVERAVSNTA